MQQIYARSPSTVEILHRRGGVRHRSWSPEHSERVEEILDLGFRAFAEATEMPIAEETGRFFRRRYRRAARRLVDRRVWRLVGDQLLAWMAHEAQLAERYATERGESVIGIIDFRQAVRDVHRLSASEFCDPTEPDSPSVS